LDKKVRCISSNNWLSCISKKWFVISFRSVRECCWYKIYLFGSIFDYTLNLL